MPEIGMSSLMSGEGKRSAKCDTAPLLDSTEHSWDSLAGVA